MEHQYVVLATVSTGWLVERDARGLALHDALEEAIADAVEAARDEAKEGDVVTRVTLVDESGERVPLTRFGQVVGRNMLLKRIQRWTDPADAAQSRLSAVLQPTMVTS
ncbi:MAG TPA: hypothetical protein VND91_05430 [Candidatus Saccharimonadia bacterium]|nr:hypothetical protein [Candidatus Saccharimonadia bacterium]